MEESQRPEPAGGHRKVIVGLGNPGQKYVETRHNLGFLAVEELARRRGLAWRDGECRARLANDATLWLVQPQTFMNRSGFTVRCLRERHDFAPEDFLITYDEIQLPLGRLRLRRKGSPAGHRGLESVVESLGTDRVPRLRLGVALEDGPPPGESWADFVLTPFAESEREAVQEMIERAADACEAWLEKGMDAAMQAFNG